MFSQMSEEKFQVAYSGDAVASGTIDVYVLAPALLSLGELVKTTNEILNGESAATSLRVEADFHKGSFEVSLILTHTLLESVRGLFAATPTVEAAGLFTTIFGAAKTAAGGTQGLFKLYKALKGEKPKSAIIDQSTHTTILVMGDGNEIHAEGTTAQLYADDRILRELDQVVRPLAVKHMDSIEVRKKEEVIDRLERQDLPLRLGAPSEDMAMVEAGKLSSTREVLLKIIKPNFESGKWTFSDGHSKLGAIIEDQNFREKVERCEEGFFSGDTLRVALRTSQRIGRNNKLEVEYVIERVIEHIHPEQPERLPLGDGR
jgi:hypothetical protein